MELKELRKKYTNLTKKICRKSFINYETYKLYERKKTKITEEYELISIYRDLNKNGQKKLLDYAKFSHSLDENLKKRK